MEDKKQPAASGRYAVELYNVTKTFGGQDGIKEITLTVPKGTILGLIGPSGSGKTTTVRVMTGILPVSSGDVYIEGRDPARFSSRDRQSIGYMTQLFTLYPDLTVKENMHFIAKIYGQGFFKRRKQISRLLEFVELGSDRRKLASRISGGMKRRLSLASTLIHDPNLIFLDEPTAGIDPILRKKFWDYFTDLKDDGKTLIVTTQYVNEASYCDIVGVLSEGELIALATPKKLRYDAFGGDLVDLKTPLALPESTLNELNSLPFMIKPGYKLEDGRYRFHVKQASSDLMDITNWLSDREIEADSIEQFIPEYDDVFVKLVSDHREAMKGEEA